MEMKTFIVYEVWTRARTIEAVDLPEAYKTGEPVPRKDDLSLCNWHVIAADGTKEDGSN